MHQEGLKDYCQKVFSHLTPAQFILETFKVKGGDDHPTLFGIGLRLFDMRIPD